MRKCHFLLLLILPLFLTRAGVARQAAMPVSPVTPHVMTSGLDRLPLSFVPNQGQMDATVRYQARSKHGILSFTPQEIMLMLLQQDDARSDQAQARERNFQPVAQAMTTIHLRFAGANPALELAETEPLPGKVNYFIGNDASRWHTNLPTYAGVIYRQLYPGIDLRYDGTQKALKGTFILAPGADPSLIRWRYEGAQLVQIDKTTGALRIGLPDRFGNDGRPGRTSGTLVEQPPVAWQEIDGKHVAVDAHYRLFGDDSVGLILPNSYNQSLPLIVDPELLYSTYLGGEGRDNGNAITVDSEGNVYVTGEWNSAGAIDTPDVFIMKLDSSGTRMIYNTLVGGSGIDGKGSDTGSGVAVDAAGNAYVTGDTNSDNFPIVNAYQSALNLHDPKSFYETDAFILKLSNSGSQLIFSTYLGGTDSERGEGIVLDNVDNIYVTGETSSIDFPTANAYQARRAGQQGVSVDLFVAKLNPNASGLVFSTYLGGADDEFNGTDIAVDASGSVYVAGSTRSTDFPTTPGAFQVTSDGFAGFVTKFTPAGNAVVYSTYLNASVEGIAIDMAGSAYVIGDTRRDFPVTTDAFQTKPGGSSDALVAKLTPAGDALVYASYLGGSGDEDGYDIAVDAIGRAYVVGVTVSADFPTVNPVQANIRSNKYRDSFVAQINPSGSSLLFSTYLGGGKRDDGAALAVDSNGIVYIVGSTESTDFPTVNAFQPNFQGKDDLFIAKINPCDCPNGVCNRPSATSQPLIVNSADADSVARNDSNLLELPEINPCPLPVIFVPGVAGSILVDPTEGDRVYWLALFDDSRHKQLTLYPDQPHPQLVAQRVLTPQDIITVPNLEGFVSKNSYGPLLDLLRRSGYRQYLDFGNPRFREPADCDVKTQQREQPKLFIFPYDWRTDNAINAQKLAKYVECVRMFYPNTDVNVIAHSMGGLLVRRYILDHPKDHHVNAFISIGSPYLGAPKMVYVAETGEFVPFAKHETIRQIVGSFTSAHQLSPSRSWYDLGGPPVIVETKWDLNENGKKNEAYDYNQLITLLDRRYGRAPFKPGSDGQTFHSFPISSEGSNQDNWRGDLHAVKYFHIYGEGKSGTIQQVNATISIDCVNPNCTEKFDRYELIARFGIGDGTVPTLSARKFGMSNNYNPLEAELFRCYLPSTRNPIEIIRRLRSGTSSNVEHTGMLSNPVILKLILQYLDEANGGKRKPRPSEEDCGKGIVKTTEVKAATDVLSAAEPTADFNVIASGITDIMVRDSLGNSTIISGSISNLVPGVTIFTAGEHVRQLLLEQGGAYTVTFNTLAEPLGIEVMQGDASIAHAVRYHDLSLPAGVTVSLVISGDIVSPLRYDGNADGIFESTISPTVDLTGAAANDTTPPTVTISGTLVSTNNVQVAITAHDSDTGLRKIFMSVDDVNYQSYHAPLNLDPTQIRAVYAFADDNAANRSQLVTYYLPSFTMPDVTISMTHVEPMQTGTQGSYTIKVSNIGKAPTTSPISVTVALPSQVELVAINGVGWTCTTSERDPICTQAATLAVGAMLPDITLVVNVTDAAWPLFETVATVFTANDADPLNNVTADKAAALLPGETQTPVATETPTPTNTPIPTPTTPAAGSTPTPPSPSGGATLYLPLVRR